MTDKDAVKLFENKNIRVTWDKDHEEWLFSVVDIISVLVDGNYQQARNYWKWLKTKLKEEGSQLVSNTNQLKLRAFVG